MTQHEVVMLLAGAGLGMSVGMALIFLAHWLVDIRWHR